MLNESINDYQKEIQSKEIKIIKKYKVDSQIFSFIDKEPLLLCFTNILKNAIRYSHEGGKVEILISKHKFVIKDY
jgi:signal transduction histidine kinase